MVTDRNARANRHAGSNPCVRLHGDRQKLQIVEVLARVIDRHEACARANHRMSFYVDARASHEEASCVDVSVFPDKDVLWTRHRLIADHPSPCSDRRACETQQSHANGDEARLRQKSRRDGRK